MALFTRAHLKETKRLHEGDIINLRVDILDGGDRDIIREVIEHNGGVVIAGQPQPDQVILVKQYRYSIDKELLELPAGRIEKGEDPLLAAKRELTEETGYQASDWSEMSRMYTAPGFCNEMLYLYLAQNLVFKGKDLDFDEETDVEILTLTEAWTQVGAGTIQDAKTIAGLGLLLARHK